MPWSRRRPPWWTSAVTTVPVAFLVGLLLYALDGRTWTDAVELASINAVGLGAVAGWGARRQRDRELATVDFLFEDEQDAAWDAARTGSTAEAPAQEAVRAGAARLVQQRLEGLEDERALVLLMLSIAAVGGAGAAVVVSPWWLALTAAAAAAWALRARHVRRLRRRHQLLRPESPAP